MAEVKTTTAEHLPHLIMTTIGIYQHTHCRPGTYSAAGRLTIFVAVVWDAAIDMPAFYMATSGVKPQGLLPALACSEWDGDNNDNRGILASKHQRS